MVALKAANTDLQKAIDERPPTQDVLFAEREQEADRMRKAMTKNVLDFDAIKKALMRDLQLRCERVVELEMSLDETREQYNNILRVNSNKHQQQKLAILEHNLEQLKNVQKQLVEQNASLRKEVTLSERKSIARTERIQNLEQQLQDAEEKLLEQNRKFEEQLRIAKDRLEQVKAKSQSPALNFGRVAKPLRGGGAAATETVPTSPIEKSKRGSWMPSFMGSR
ncbi:hypothetical protein BY458DRAFT_131551 [Sporodiniella umbellata]|nr:hypothetical protein BY458DRAFT_131551 [Sporodiniella umbellata]